MGRPDPFNRRLREQVTHLCIATCLLQAKTDRARKFCRPCLAAQQIYGLSISRRAGAAMCCKPLHHRCAPLIETHHFDLHVVAAQLEHDVIERTN